SRRAGNARDFPRRSSGRPSSRLAFRRPQLRGSSELCLQLLDVVGDQGASIAAIDLVEERRDCRSQLVRIERLRYIADSAQPECAQAFTTLRQSTDEDEWDVSGRPI